MLHKLITCFALVFLFSCCDSNRTVRLDTQKKKMENEIRIGDDIYQAKDKLIEAGFKIKFGPDFPTKTKKYLMMIVDYGVTPGELETFKYTVGLEGSDKPITGIIKATPEGKITSIE